VPGEPLMRRTDHWQLADHTGCADSRSGPVAEQEFPILNGGSSYIDRIFKRPAELPVEPAAMAKLAINLKTAKTLGADHLALLL